MGRKFFVYLIPLFIVLFAAMGSLAQTPLPGLAVGDSTNGKRLEILEAKRYNFQKIDSTGDFVSLAGNVRIRQGKTLFYCDSAVLDQKRNIFEAFGNIHINDEDSVHTYSQYLKYYGKEKDAILKKNVRLTDGKGVLTTNDLKYNTITKIGTYDKGGKVVTGKTVLTSTEGIYYGETRDIYFKKKVVMIDPEFKVTTDTLLYNTYTEIARFTVPTTIVNKQRTIKTSEGYYDLKNKKAVFGKRPFIDDKDYTLTADDIAIDEQSGFGDALGNVIYKTKDTANPASIIANRLQTNNKNSALLATQNPVMIIKQGNDSIFIAADTLYSAKLSDLRKTRDVPSIYETKDTIPLKDSLQATGIRNETSPRFGNKIDLGAIKKINPDNNLKNDEQITVVGDSITRQDTSATIVVKSKNQRVKTDTGVVKPPLVIAKATRQPIQPKDSISTSKNTNDSSNNRFVEAYYNVKIFSDSMQAIGDSMFYSFEDSAFRLFKNPVVWANENQITGDTIYMFTNNKKPERMYVFENALAINKVDQFYNQIKGNTINANFIAGNIDNIRARGSAENIYYAADDAGKYIGVNRSTSDVIDVYFAKRKPKKVVFRNNLQGTTSPMNQVDHSELRLRGFKWLEDRRPKSKTDLFGG